VAAWVTREVRGAIADAALLAGPRHALMLWVFPAHMPLSSSAVMIVSGDHWNISVHW
jgi:hypothetical protein